MKSNYIHICRVALALAAAGFAGLAIGAIPQSQATSAFTQIEAQLVERDGNTLLRISVDFDFSKITDYDNVGFEVLDAAGRVIAHIPLETALEGLGDSLLGEDGTVNFVVPNVEGAVAVRVSAASAQDTVGIAGASPVGYPDQRKATAEFCHPQCVDHVADKAPSLVAPKCWRDGFTGKIGNPSSWIARAQKCKYKISTTPDATFVIVMPRIGSVGHVAYSTQKSKPSKNSNGFYAVIFTDSNWLFQFPIE